MEGSSIWQDRTNLVLGLWLVVSPLVLGYGDLLGPAAWNSYMAGSGVALFSLSAIQRPRPEFGWMTLGLALWLTAAPLLLGFADRPFALWNHLVLGVLIGGGALSSAALNTAMPAAEDE